jgi:hypothetical protein
MSRSMSELSPTGVSIETIPDVFAILSIELRDFIDRVAERC